MSMKYSTFTFNNESVILLPGQRFSKKELLSRLHEMDANIDNYQDKSSLNNLYDSYLSDNRNKLKIYNRLKKDTENLNSIGFSQKQSIMASNANTISNNSKNNFLNKSNEIKPFSEQQNINNYNREGKIQKINISKNYEQNLINQNYNYEYNDNQMENNNYKNYQDSRISQNTNDINNSNFSQYNNSQNQFNYQQKNDNLKNNFNNSINNSDKINNINNNMTYIQPYQEEINTGRNNKQRYYQENTKDNQKIFTNIQTPNPIYQDPRNSLLKSGNSNNNNYIRNSNINFSFNDNYNPNYNNQEYSNQMNPYQNQNNKNQRMIIEEQNQSMFPDDENKNITYQPSRREPDEESTFSIFSTFKDFKNSSLYKNRKQICFNLLISLIVFLIAIGSLNFIYNCWDSISNFFTEFFNILIDPKRITEGIFGFFSSVLFSSIRYFYIVIPLIAFIVWMVILGKKYLFKRRCKEILKKILEYLKNNENRENNIIYEEEIYRRFVQGNGVSYEYFINRYIPVMYKLRRDYPLKTYNTINGKNTKYWALQ